MSKRKDQVLPAGMSPASCGDAEVMPSMDERGFIGARTGNRVLCSARRYGFGSRTSDRPPQVDAASRSFDGAYRSAKNVLEVGWTDLGKESSSSASRSLLSLLTVEIREHLHRLDEQRPTIDKPFRLSRCAATLQASRPALKTMRAALALGGTTEMGAGGERRQLD